MLARCCCFVWPANESNPDWTSDNGGFHNPQMTLNRFLVVFICKKEKKGGKVLIKHRKKAQELKAGSSTMIVGEQTPPHHKKNLISESVV